MKQTLKCQCGTVALEAKGEPILSTICHCPECQKAGALLEALPGAARILNDDNGTSLTLFRKDRVHCLRGEGVLREHRLDAATPTRRVVATCCNTAMFLDFTKGHWMSVFGSRLEVGADTGPQQNAGSIFFILRLVAVWAKMGFRTPKINYVAGTLKVPKN